MLDFRIHTFLTLYKEMNYRRTAEILNMTQPGVTQHIHYLENHYGVKLFEYNGRMLSRSKNAEILKHHIDSMAAEERAMRGEFAVQEGSHLDVGATKTIGEFVLAPIFRQFLSESSHTMNLVIDNTETLLHMLENSELDFAVVEGISLINLATVIICSKRKALSVYVRRSIGLPDKTLRLTKLSGKVLL